MNCEQARQAWHRRWDDDVVEGGADGLPASVGRVDPAVDEHLRSCQQCRAYHAQMDAIAGALDELREESESIVSRRHGAEAPARRRSWSSVLRPLTRIAAVLALVVTAGLYFSSERAGNGLPDIGALVGNMNVADENDVFVSAVSPAKDVTEITLQGESAKRYLAVATPTSQPGVRLFWLYPTVGEPSTSDPSQESQP